MLVRFVCDMVDTADCCVSACVWQGLEFDAVMLGNDFTFGTMAGGQQIRGLEDEENVRCGGGITNTVGTESRCWADHHRKAIRQTSTEMASRHVLVIRRGGGADGVYARRCQRMCSCGVCCATSNIILPSNDDGDMPCESKSKIKNGRTELPWQVSVLPTLTL